MSYHKRWTRSQSIKPVHVIHRHFHSFWILKSIMMGQLKIIHSFRFLLNHQKGLNSLLQHKPLTRLLSAGRHTQKHFRTNNTDFLLILLRGNFNSHILILTFQDFFPLCKALCDIYFERLGRQEGNSRGRGRRSRTSGVPLRAPAPCTG